MIYLVVILIARTFWWSIRFDCCCDCFRRFRPQNWNHSRLNSTPLNVTEVDLPKKLHQTDPTQNQKTENRRRWPDYFINNLPTYRYIHFSVKMMRSFHYICIAIVVLSLLNCSLASCPPPQTTVVVHNTNGHGYEIIRDEVVYSRWRSIISRLVRMPNGQEVDYDVSAINQPYVCFPSLLLTI